MHALDKPETSPVRINVKTVNTSKANVRRFLLIHSQTEFSRTTGAPQTSGDAFVKSVSYCVSHEIGEALTNRDGGGYFRSSDGCEIGDLCEQNGNFNYRGWDVEQYWSNV